MASLVGAITALSLIGAPSGSPVWTTVAKGGAPSEPASPITRLGLTGTATRLYGAFSKQPVGLVLKTVSDSATLSVLEDPMDERYLTTGDSAYLRITETLLRLNHLGVTDTASLLLAEGVELQGAGVNESSPTDTASLSVAEAVTLDISVDLTDTASISVTGTPTILVSTLAQTVTDTASISITETSITDKVSGSRAWQVGELAQLSLSEATLLEKFESDELAYITRIAVTFDAPTITFRMTGGR